jgi:hypothetical protein
MQACLREADAKQAETAAASGDTTHLTPEQKILSGVGINVSSTDDVSVVSLCRRP